MITSLKSQIFVNKIRKRGCDSRKWLTETEKKEIAEMTQDFFKYCNIIHSLKIEKKKTDLDGIEGLFLFFDV
ncbi:unnamed protein product [Wuchereria bancrofti]|uniref:Uncharacterized protein n=1 Tax=Wuchereria bancrofti TaxID=6293 RepID=A0A3P7EPR5_WUCBA|nr:unnamed protein product [Wuchereria bancrofti]